MKQVSSLFTLLALATLSVLPFRAQQFVAHYLPTQSQLPMASIHCIWQDREGYLWYGTEGGGLCRDNGYQIDVFRPACTANPSEACQVHCLAELASGDILFGTSDGLFHINKHDYQISRIALDSLPQRIDALMADREGHLWAASKGCIYQCQADGQVTEAHDCRLRGERTSVSSFYEDSRGTIFALLWGGGLMRMQQGGKGFEPLRWPIGETPLQMLEDRELGCYWVLTSGAGIQRMTVEGNVCRLTPQTATMGSHGRDHGLNMLRDSRHGLFWVTTLDNLYAYSLAPDGQLREFPLTGLLPEGNKILDQMLESRDGDVYVAGYTPHTFVVSSPEGGITRHAVEAIRRATGFPLLADRAVFDGGRYIWIWQGRQGLMLYDRLTDSVEPSPRKVGRTLQRSSLGGIWASSGNHVFRLWQENGQVREETVTDLPQNEEVRNIVECDEQHLYIASQCRLYRLSLIGHQLRVLASLPAALADMDVSRQGDVYLALGALGLHRLSTDGQLERIDDSGEDFLSLSMTVDGTLWASTYEGNVYCYSPVDGTLRKEPLLCSSDAVPIRNIRTDGLGHVWTLTDQQLVEYAPRSRAFRVVRNVDPFVDVSYFYALEPVATNCMGIDGAGALLEVPSSAELGQQGAVDVRPRVSSVGIDGAKRLIGDDVMELRLKASEQDITLHLTTLDHRHVSAISFAYQLEGVNRDWIYLPQGTNSIILTNLGKGSHQLRVMATDRYGCWSSPVEVLLIHRAAYWYETWWARLLYVAIVFVLGYGIWRLENRISLLRHLIRRRREVRLDEIELKREDIASARRDDDLLRRAIAKVEENLSRPDYNVSSLSDDLFMSRITLYRRIQELTGQSPTDFIRDIRLKKAAQLLQQNPDAVLADVARKVGFATPKYFSKCFKEKFGVLPRDYVSK
ncbi:MAG: helix-turn-helix domain-containing protein [Bacteroidaceae bacterium]|nr:helix-turn-helix domain-containing protein [Bacteroidaceae bacterium]